MGRRGFVTVPTAVVDVAGTATHGTVAVHCNAQCTDRMTQIHTLARGARPPRLARAGAVGPLSIRYADGVGHVADVCARGVLAGVALQLWAFKACVPP